jgi:hypothetical protein
MHRLVKPESNKNEIRKTTQPENILIRHEQLKKWLVIAVLIALFNICVTTVMVFGNTVVKMIEHIVLCISFGSVGFIE